MPLASKFCWVGRQTMQGHIKDFIQLRKVIHTLVYIQESSKKFVLWNQECIWEILGRNRISWRWFWWDWTNPCQTHQKVTMGDSHNSQEVVKMFLKNPHFISFQSWKMFNWPGNYLPQIKKGDEWGADGEKQSVGVACTTWLGSGLVPLWKESRARKASCLKRRHRFITTFYGSGAKWTAKKNWKQTIVIEYFNFEWYF